MFFIYFISLDDGNNHKARQWDLVITGPNFEEDGCRIALQVMAEVTGKSRESRKRQKRPYEEISRNGDAELDITKIQTIESQTLSYFSGVETEHAVSI